MDNKELEEIMMRQEDLHPDLIPWIVEEEKIGPCLKHPLLLSLFYHPQMNAMLNMQYMAKKERVEICLKNKEYIQYIWYHERPYRMNKFAEIQDYLSDKDYWSLLGSIWTDSENIWQHSDFIEQLIKNDRPQRIHIMDEEEQKFFSDLPEEITIYRGHQKHNKIGYSWSLSYWTAHWFAHRFQSKKPGIVRAIVKKKDVIAAFLGRNEFEIVVDPSNLTEVKSISKTPEINRPIWMNKLKEEFEKNYALKISSYHGPWHWEKVENNGIILAKNTPGADVLVVRMFALIHDSKRVNEDDDPNHGIRAGEYAQKLWMEGKISLNEEQIKLLVEACKYHNDGTVTENPTIGVCWDADRLDLVRVGIVPDIKYFSTNAAKNLLWKI